MKWCLYVAPFLKKEKTLSGWLADCLADKCYFLHLPSFISVMFITFLFLTIALFQSFAHSVALFANVSASVLRSFFFIGSDIMKPHLQIRKTWKNTELTHAHTSTFTGMLCTLYVDVMLLLTWLTLFNRQKVGHRIQIIPTIWCWLIFINWSNEFVCLLACASASKSTSVYAYMCVSKRTHRPTIMHLQQQQQKRNAEKQF